MEDEVEANKILSACTRLVLFIAKNKFNNFGYKAMMEMLLLDKEKKELINSVFCSRMFIYINKIIEIGSPIRRH